MPTYIIPTERACEIIPGETTLRQAFPQLFEYIERRTTLALDPTTGKAVLGPNRKDRLSIDGGYYPNPFNYGVLRQEDAAYSKMDQAIYAFLTTAELRDGVSLYDAGFKSGIDYNGTHYDIEGSRLPSTVYFGFCNSGLEMAYGLDRGLLSQRNISDKPMIALVECAVTHGTYPTDEMMNFYRVGWVHESARDRIFECWQCGAYEILPEGQTIDDLHTREDFGHPICPTCERNAGAVHNCDVCGVVIMHDDRGNTAWRQGELVEVCFDCRQDLTSDYAVQSYSYKPKPWFLGDDGKRSRTPKGDTFFGIELECSFSGSDDYGLDDYYDDDAECNCESCLRERAREDGHGGLSVSEDSAVALVMQNGNDKKLYCKEDGSISDGFEIVSHPMSLLHWQNHFDWSWAKKLADNGMVAWNDSTCGLHIHVSKTAWESKPHFARWWMLMFGNSDAWVQLAGRHSTSYASWRNEGEGTSARRAYAVKDPDVTRRIRASLPLVPPRATYEESIEIDRRRRQIMATHTNKAALEAANQDGGRYSAINLHNEHTVELRFWRPSLKYTTVLASIEATAASVEYARVAKFNPKLKEETLTMKALVQWAALVGGYPCFVRRAVERGVVTQADLDSLWEPYATALTTELVDA